MTQRRFLLSDFVAKGENRKGMVTQTAAGTTIKPWQGWNNQGTTPERLDGGDIVWDERRDRLGKPKAR
jgi:hypothetical protein